MAANMGSDNRKEAVSNKKIVGGEAEVASSVCFAALYMHIESAEVAVGMRHRHNI